MVDVLAGSAHVPIQLQTFEGVQTDASWSVGAKVGTAVVGEAVGARVGTVVVGEAVGARVGTAVVGDDVAAVGVDVAAVGVDVAAVVGDCEGADSDCDGADVGLGVEELPGVGAAEASVGAVVGA